nr:histidine kinase dimerization/phospho-acceptor domain-containing protein [Tessaracoccus coleopterorum]
MHPALAGLIGAGVALAGCLFWYLIYRGREGWRQLEAQRAADLVSRELRDVLALVPSGVVMVGPDDEILIANEQASQLSLARGNRVGFSELLEKVRDARATSTPYLGPLAREAVPGTQALELEVRIAPFDDERVLVLAEDESSKRRIEAVRRDFVANISHELKTPIGAISVLSEAVEVASDDPEAVQRFATKLQIETARLAELINQIIDLSRLQSEDPMLASQVVDVNDIVTEAVARSRERATQREVSLIVARTSDALVLGTGGSSPTRSPTSCRTPSTTRGAGAGHRVGRGHREGRRSAGGDQGLRQRHRHQARGPGADLRTLLPRRLRPLARQWRHRPRAFHRAPHRSGARRYGASLVEARPGIDLHPLHPMYLGPTPEEEPEGEAE